MKNELILKVINIDEGEVIFVKIFNKTKEDIRELFVNYNEVRDGCLCEYFECYNIEYNVLDGLNYKEDCEIIL